MNVITRKRKQDLDSGSKKFTHTHQNSHFDIIAELLISESQKVKQYYEKSIFFFSFMGVEDLPVLQIYPVRIRRWNKALIT